MSKIRTPLLAGALAILAPAVASHAQQTSEEGIYTAEQAARGKAVYTAHCAACHGPTLQGATATPLSGAGFAASWGLTGIAGDWAESDFTVDDLFFVIRTTMPPGSAKAIPADDHLTVSTYILQQNGYPAGNTVLTADSLRLKETPLRFGLPPEAALIEPPLVIKGKAESAPTGGGPSQEELNAAHDSTSDWLYHTHDYSGRRFVDLDQINAGNAGQLQVA